MDRERVRCKIILFDFLCNATPENPEKKSKVTQFISPNKTKKHRVAKLHSYYYAFFSSEKKTLDSTKRKEVV